MSNSNYVLLVEDNPDEVFLTRRAFQKGEIASPLKVVTDGRQALDFLFSQGTYADRDVNDKPVLILLDLKLPLVSGLDVLNAVKTNPSTSLIPIIVLTSSTEDEDRTKCYHLGANDYINKPTGLTEFVEKIKSIKLKWLICN
jgi:two-component system, response regulator